jgi:hypothetical protein
MTKYLGILKFGAKDFKRGGLALLSTEFNQTVPEDLAVGRSCISGCCGSELAATITNNIYVQEEKTVLAASDVEKMT